MLQSSMRFPLFLCHAQLNFRKKGCFSAYLNSLERFRGFKAAVGIFNLFWIKKGN